MDNSKEPKELTSVSEKHKRTRFWAYLEGIMFIVWIITTIIFVSTVFSQSTRCLNNPLVFGADNLSELNKDDFSCKCSFENSPNQIEFNKEGWKYVDSTEVYLNFTGG